MVVASYYVLTTLCNNRTHKFKIKYVKSTSSFLTVVKFKKSHHEYPSDLNKIFSGTFSRSV